MSSDTAEVKPPRGRRLPLRFWVALVLVVLAGIFVAQNRDRKPVHVLWITVESPMWLILTVMFVAGLLVGLLLRLRRRR